MTQINYELIRSARKTICISIRDKRVIVRAPLRTSVEKIDRFVQQKKEWILKKLSTDNGYDYLSGYEFILVKGQKVPLVFANANKIGKDCVSVKKLSDLNKLYIQTFSEEFLRLFDEVSQASGLSATSVSFRSYKARWGCCDLNKRIIFNYKLLMLPVELWRCVIVHELCHTVFMDHSKNFHALAVSVMPNYNEVHAELKKFGAVTRLY